MKKLTTLLEAFTNLFTIDDKNKYVDDVWEMLQNAYQYQGGLKGSGFSSKEEMMREIHMWKLGKVKGKLVCVAMYKNKNGRKRVAIATDGTDEGKHRLLEILRDDIKSGRAYVELSGASLGFMYKHYPKLVLQTIVPKATVMKKMPTKQFVDTQVSQRDLEKYPVEITSQFYTRKLGTNATSTKVMLGNIYAPPIIL